MLESAHNQIPYQLGPKALKDAFENMRSDIAEKDEIINPKIKHNLTRNERIALKTIHAKWCTQH